MASHTYGGCIEQSVRVQWRLDDVLPPDQQIDFSRPHLPDALVKIDELDFLDEKAKLTLNHIRGHSYMNLFAFVEEYIIPQIVRHAEAELFGDPDAVRALLRFAEEEVKHQKMFRRYCDLFARDFGTPVEVLGQSIAVAQIILEKTPAAAMLTTLHLEIITQEHYTSSIKDNANLDPLFCSILKNHWLEEAQHAKLDMLELEKMLEGADDSYRRRAVSEYFDILTAFDGLLAEQVAMDVRSLEAKACLALDDSQRQLLVKEQHQSYRDDFILMGLRNKTFNKFVGNLFPGWEQVASENTARYC